MKPSGRCPRSWRTCWVWCPCPTSPLIKMRQDLPLSSCPATANSVSFMKRPPHPHFSYSQPSALGGRGLEKTSQLQTPERAAQARVASQGRNPAVGGQEAAAAGRHVSCLKGRVPVPSSPPIQGGWTRVATFSVFQGKLEIYI